MSPRTLAPLPFLVALSLFGCGHQIEFQDNFSGLFEESVQRPYAVGTTATISVQWSNLAAVDRRWVASSEDAGVVQVLSQEIGVGATELQVTVKAMGVGETHLVVMSGTHRMASTLLQVVEATELQLLDHALQRIEDKEQDVGSELRVVVGQAVAMEIRYLTAAQHRAWGRDLLTWSESPALTVWTDAETLGRDAEYLLAQPDDLGTYDLEVSMNGAPQRTMRIIGVNKAEIARIELLPPPEQNAKEGDRVCGGLLAYDADDNRIYGPPADWTVNGVSVGSGDLLCYEYAPRQPAASVTVQVGSTGGQLLVRGRDFYVDSTPIIGCSVAGTAAARAAGGLLAGLLLLGCALLLRRVLR